MEMNSIIELQTLLSQDDGTEHDSNKYEQAVFRIKHSPATVFVGFASITSFSFDPIIRILCTNVNYYRLSPNQKRLLLVLWNYFRRRLSSDDTTIIDRDIYSDLLGLAGLELLYSCVLPGSLVSTRPRLGSKWLRLSLNASEVQKLISTIDALIQAIYDRSPMEVLTSIFPSFHSIRLPQLEGWTMLHVICSERNLSTEKLIKDILRAGLDSSVQDNQGRTALHIAAYHFNWTAVNALTVLVPTVRLIVDNRGDIPLVTLLRAMSISPWIKIISPERISSLFNMLIPSTFYREFWSTSLNDTSLTKLLKFGDETVVGECLVSLKRDLSFPHFQSLLFHLITSISKRYSKLSLVLLRTATELLPLVTADLMRLHGDSVEYTELCAFFLDLVLGTSFKFYNIDMAIEGIVILNNFFELHASFCRRYSWVFPHYALLVLDTELLRSALDKFTVESFDFFFLQRIAIGSSESPLFTPFAIVPLGDMMQKWLLQEAAPSSLFLFQNVINNESADRMSIIELACASHANIAVHAICKSAQRVFRVAENSSWSSLQERCLSQALLHHNWKAIDLIKVLHDALYLHSKNKTVNMTLSETTVHKVCVFLSRCFSSSITPAANDSPDWIFNDDVAQTLGRLITCFPAKFISKKAIDNREWPSNALVKQIHLKMEDITKQIDHLLLSIRGLGPGGALTTPILWKNHLQEGSYQEYRSLCLAHQKEMTELGNSLYSSFHGATLRRIFRNFVPDLKWQKLAYSLLLFVDCVENPEKLLSSSVEYDNLYDKQWSRVESMFAVAVRSSTELQKWSERLLSGLNLLMTWSGSTIVTAVQNDAVEFFLSKYQNLGNLRYANNRPSNKNIAGMASNGSSDDSIFPSREKLQTYKRESATVSDLYTLYDRIISYFASVVAPKLLQLFRETPTTRQNQAQHLSFKEYLLLHSLDQRYQRLCDVYSQLKVNDENIIASTNYVEGDFLQYIFANSVIPNRFSEGNISLELLFMRDLQFFAGQGSTWSTIKSTLTHHRLHQRDSSPIHSKTAVLDETLKAVIEKCDCSADRLLLYVPILTQNRCFQSALAILLRYHQNRLQFSFDDWNVFQRCYFVQSRSSRNGKPSRICYLSTLDSVMDSMQKQTIHIESIIQEIENGSYKPCLYDQNNKAYILTPLHFALLHNQTDFIRSFVSIFPRYPVNLHSLAIFIEKNSLHSQWQLFLPYLSFIVQFMVVDTDVSELQSLLGTKNQLSLLSRMGGSNGHDLRFGQRDRSYFLSTWNIIHEFIISIHGEEKKTRPIDWAPLHWVITSSFVSTISTSPSVYALSQARQECDYVTKTAKLFSPLSQPPSSPSKAAFASSSALTITSSSQSIRLMAMMDGTWMSYEDVTSQYHNYQRALPAPLILEGHGSLAHALCAFLTYYLDDNDQGQEFLSFLINKIPELTKLFFLRLGKSKPSPLYLLLRDGKYSLALMIMKQLVSSSHAPNSNRSSFHVDGILKLKQSSSDGLLREQVLSTLKNNLNILRGMFPVPKKEENVKSAQEHSVREDHQLLLGKYLIAHETHTELTFCASCLEYSQDLWRKLILSPSTAQRLSSSSSQSTTKFTKALVFSQHAGRADLMKHDSVVRARQVLSILQIAYSQLIPTADTNHMPGKDKMSRPVLENHDSNSISNPDLLFVSPSYLCRRVTSSMFHQLKLLLTGWLHPKLTATTENQKVKKVFASLQVVDDNLLFHHPSFSCLQFLSEELRQYQSATVLDKENVISSYISQLPTQEHVASSKNSTFTMANPSVASASSHIMLQLVRPEDWAALDTISFALLILEYARSLCVARISCVVSYPEDMNTWIPSSYAKHPLTVIRRQIASLSEDIIALEREIKSDAQVQDETTNEVMPIPKLFFPSQMSHNLGRGLRSRIGLLDRLTPDDMITFLQCSAVYSPRLKRLRDVLVSSMSSMLTDLGKHYAGKMISRLEKKIHIPNYHNKETPKLTVFDPTAGIPEVFSSAFEADLRVLSEDIIPSLRSLKLIDFWQTGRFPLFRHTFENVVIENEQDYLVDMVHSLKQGVALTVTEEEESAIYFAFQRQAPIDTSSVTTAFGNGSTTSSIAQKSNSNTISARQQPPHGHSIPFEITQSQRLYSKSAMDTVHRLRQALHTASVLYWFVGSCYGLIAESRTSTMYDNDVALVLDLFHSSSQLPSEAKVKEDVSITNLASTIQGNLQFHPLLPLITHNPSCDITYEHSTLSNQSLTPTATRPPDASKSWSTGKKGKPHSLAVRAQQRLELIRFMIDPTYNQQRITEENTVEDLNQAQHSIHVSSKPSSNPSSLFYLSKHSLLPMEVFNGASGAGGGKTSSPKEQFSLLEMAAFYGDSEAVFYLLNCLSPYVEHNQKRKTADNVDYLLLTDHWSNLLWTTLACAKISAAQRYEECFRLLWKFHDDHLSIISGQQQSLSFCSPWMLQAIRRKDNHNNETESQKNKEETTDMQSLTTIDLAAVKGMPTLVIEMFDRLVTQAAAAAVSPQTASSSPTTFMQDVKHSASILSLVALSLHALRTAGMETNAATAIYHKAFQSLLSALYTQCKQGTFNLYDLFRMETMPPSDEGSGKLGAIFAQECVVLGEAFNVWTRLQQPSLISPNDEKNQNVSDVNWVQILQDRFVGAFANENEIKGICIEPFKNPLFQDLLRLSHIHFVSDNKLMEIAECDEDNSQPGETNWTLLNLAIVMNDTALFMKQLDIDFPSIVTPKTLPNANQRKIVSPVKSNAEKQALKERQQCLWQRFLTILTSLIELERVSLLTAFVAYLETTFQNETTKNSCWWVEKLLPHSEEEQRHSLSIAVYEIKTLFLQQWFPSLCKRNRPSVCETLQCLVNVFFVAMVRFAGKTPSIGDTEDGLLDEENKQRQRLWVMRLVEDDLLPLLVQKCSVRDSYLVLLLEGLWQGCCVPTEDTDNNHMRKQKIHKESSSMLWEDMKRLFWDYRLMNASSPLLHWWIRRRQFHLVRFWIQRISPNIVLLQDDAGYTALDTAIGTGDKGITRLMKPLLPWYLRTCLHRMVRALHALRLKRVIARSEAFLAQFDPVKQKSLTEDPVKINSSEGEINGSQSDQENQDANSSHLSSLSSR